MGYDHVLEKLGEFGRYQQRIYILLCLPAISCAFHKLAWVFLGAKADHRYAHQQHFNRKSHDNFCNDSYGIKAVPDFTGASFHLREQMQLTILMLKSGICQYHGIPFLKTFRRVKDMMLTFHKIIFVKMYLKPKQLLAQVGYLTIQSMKAVQLWRYVNHFIVQFCIVEDNCGIDFIKICFLSCSGT